jgi:hypothetical protein
MWFLDEVWGTAMGRIFLDTWNGVVLLDEGMHLIISCAESAKLCRSGL